MTTFRHQVRGYGEPPLREFSARPPRATWLVIVFALVGALIIAAGAIWLAAHGG